MQYLCLRCSVALNPLNGIFSFLNGYIFVANGKYLFFFIFLLALWSKEARISRKHKPFGELIFSRLTETLFASFKSQGHLQLNIICSIFWQLEHQKMWWLPKEVTLWSSVNNWTFNSQLKKLFRFWTSWIFLQPSKRFSFGMRYWDFNGLFTSIPFLYFLLLYRWANTWILIQITRILGSSSRKNPLVFALPLYWSIS